MSLLSNLEPKEVFEYFERISAIPRPSGLRAPIAEYCLQFAKEQGLRAVRDKADNIIIYKAGQCGKESSPSVILQGHLDMVCQRESDFDIDFEREGLDLYIDGDFLKARGTSLGGDNGIAAAMIFAILSSRDIPHPPIEAVFTSDEEIGMIGALQLDMSALSAKRMINLDTEEENSLTVSCAGGSDFLITLPTETIKKSGYAVSITLSGLKGGHSGVEINKGRINADMALGRLLNHLSALQKFDIISLSGGDKANAIPPLSGAELLCENGEQLRLAAAEFLNEYKSEISAREKDFRYEISIGQAAEHSVFSDTARERAIFLLSCAPNGIIEMSAEIEGLVETSLNLGILKTESEQLSLHFALRSNKRSALKYLEERLSALCRAADCQYKKFGHYPPWEYKPDSLLRPLYSQLYREKIGEDVKVEAIHAGLECGVFAGGIGGLDCIAIGPDIFDVHTCRERLSIPSTQRIFKLLCELLGRL